MAGIVLMACFKVIDDRRQYSLSHMFQYSFLEMIVRAKMEKGPKKIFTSRRKGEVRLVQNVLKIVFSREF